jgi:hypothetical protein
VASGAPRGRRSRWALLLAGAGALTVGLLAIVTNLATQGGLPGVLKPLSDNESLMWSLLGGLLLLTVVLAIASMHVSAPGPGGDDVEDLPVTAHDGGPSGNVNLTQGPVQGTSYTQIIYYSAADERSGTSRTRLGELGIFLSGCAAAASVVILGVMVWTARAESTAAPVPPSPMITAAPSPGSPADACPGPGQEPTLPPGGRLVLNCADITLAVPTRWQVHAVASGPQACQLNLSAGARSTQGRDVLVHGRGAGIVHLHATACATTAIGSDDDPQLLPLRLDPTARSGATPLFTATGPITVTMAGDQEKCNATLFDDSGQRVPSLRAVVGSPLTTSVGAGRYWLETEVDGCALTVAAVS